VFAQNKMDAKTMFKVVRSANHETNLLGVANKQVDVATNNSEALEKLKEAHKNQDIAAIDAATAEMNTVWTAASEEIYKAQAEAGAGAQAGPQGGTQAGGGQAASDTVTDAEFEEVK
jgi:hypothetical protein